MSDKPYWQQLRDLKLGKPSPAPGKQTKSADRPADEERPWKSQPPPNRRKRAQKWPKRKEYVK